MGFEREIGRGKCGLEEEKKDEPSKFGTVTLL